MYEYCNKSKLAVNTAKIKVMLFHKGLQFTHGNDELQIVPTFTYSGHVFSKGGSFALMQHQSIYDHSCFAFAICM
jgi:hypothetical protein